MDGVGLAHKAGNADSFSRRLSFEYWDSFPRFDIRTAFDELTGHSRAAALDTIERRVGRLAYNATRHLLNWLDENNGEAADAIRALRDMQAPSWLQNPGAPEAQSYAQQIDALKMSFDMAGIDRRAGLATLRHPSQPDDLRLDQITTNLHEDQIINRDAHQFPGWLPEATAYGAEFEDPRTGRRLQTFLANKVPLEKRTGADMIYFVEDFNSFVLVQYKRCRLERNEVPIYRPDGQLQLELDRMAELESVARDESGELSSLRLGATFCLAKLCDPRQPLKTDLSTGMYFDRQCFSSVVTAGPRGGLRIVYGEVSRYITNSVFTELVSQGWIGSSGNQSEKVILAMEEALDEDHTVFLASIRLGGNRRGPGGGGVRARPLRRS